MKATIVDLRYRMKDVLKALERNEDVEVLYHGKTKGILSPVRESDPVSAADHPFFGSRVDDSSVEEHMDRLRGGRTVD